MLAVAAALAGTAALHLTVSYDLAQFLPPPTTPEQHVLVDRLGKDAGSRSMFVVLPNASDDASAKAASALRALPNVRRVLPEEEDFGPETVPGVLWQHRLLLKDPPADEAAWHAVLVQRLADTALADSDGLLALVAADPLLASVDALAMTGEGAGSFPRGDTHYLLALTNAPSFDVGAQSELVGAAREALDEAGFAGAKLYGSGVYAADLQATVRREATLFSLLASGALLGLLLWRFRSLAIVVAVGAPMLFGAAAGLALLALLYGEVHGIALAFGFTLLGVTVDYPLHLFGSRAGHAQRGALVWPTLRLGIASTLIAYAAFVLAGEGLRQLGLFAICGVAAAAAAAAWIGNAPLATAKPQAPAAANVHMRHWPWLATLAIATAALLARPPFLDDLGTLTPVPRATLAADAELRAQLGAGEMRHFVAVAGDALESVLVRTEAAAAHLAAAQGAGELAGYSSVTALLPSLERQRTRRGAWLDFVTEGGASAPDGEFARAASALGFAHGVFEAFHEAAVATSTAAPLTREELAEDPALGTLMDAHLYRSHDGWTSLIALRGIVDANAVAARLTGVEGVDWVDMKRASTSLVAGLRNWLLTLLGAALALVGILLWLQTRDGRRVAWLLGTTLAAAAASAALGSWLRGGLSPFDLMALALVVGLGLDYTLFYSKPHRDADDAADTQRAVDICAASSFLVFGILAFSSIPVLHGLGSTVAAGVACAYLLSRFSRYSNPGTPSSDRKPAALSSKPRTPASTAAR